MENTNLSKMAKADHSNKKKNRAISSEKSLSKIKKFNASSKTASNKNLDGEKSLQDLPKGTDGHSIKAKAISSEKSLQETPKFKAPSKTSSKPLKSEKSLAETPKFRNSGSNPSNKKLSSDASLASDLCHVKKFEAFVNENYDSK